MLRVLGPLVVTGTDGPVNVGGPVPRRILTALLTRPGETLPADWLVLAAWGDVAPASAERTLQSHLTRLREALQQVDGGVGLERRDGGFRLLVRPEDVDAVRFEHLVDAARDASPADAVPLLRDALALWRPPAPYADLQDTAYPAAEAARLGELHGAAAEALVAAALDSGDPAEAAAEAEARLADDPYREPLWELLVLALYRQGRQGDALAAYQRARHELADGLGVEPGPALRDLEARVLAQDATLLVRPSSPRTACPYKGLARYDAADAGIYVGREKLVEELVARLVDSRFMVVVGPSGAGKSSLVRAGLLPALEHGGLRGSESWDLRVIVPGAAPVSALEAALEGRPDVVVVDQAEEALLARDGAFVRAFGDAVLRSVDAGTRVVLALRADFYGRLAEHPGLARVAGPASVIVTPPDDDELRRIVVEPAARIGLRVDTELADLVVSEVRGRPGVLPVLSTALVRTWQHREDGALTVASYRAGGGVQAALQRVGEEAWAALDGDAERAACRRLLLRLAADEDGQWVRRRARLADVAPAGDADGSAALAVLTDRRLVVTRADDVEIAHESLLTGWPRLMAWLEDSRSRREVLERLSAAASAWEAGDHDPSELYRGTRLQAALDTAAVSPADLTATEVTFLDASRAEVERELTEQRERADHEARGRRRTRAVAAGLAGALVLGGVAGGYAVHQQGVAQDAAAASDAAARAADAGRLGAIARTGGAYDLALLYAAQAEKLDPSPQSDSDLLATLQRGAAVTSVRRAPGLEKSLTYSSDGRHILGVTDDGRVTQWPAAGGPATTTARLDDKTDERTLVARGDGTVVVSTEGGPAVVDPTSGRIVTRAPGPSTGWVLAPDGRTLFGPVYDETTGDAAIWALGTPAPAPQDGLLGFGVWTAVGCGAVACFTYGETGHLARVRLRDHVVLPALLLPGDCFEGPVVSSPDGSRVALLCDGGLIKVMDTRSGAVVRTLPGGTLTWRPLAFSPDGRRLVTSDFDTVLVWTLDDPLALPDRLLGHSGKVTAAAFSPNGSSLVTAADDRIVITWDLRSPTRLAKVVTTSLPDLAGTLWATGTRAVLGMNDGHVLVVDLATGRIDTLAGRIDAEPADNPMVTARMGRVGDLLVAAATDGATGVWDVGTQRLLGVVDVPAPDPTYGADVWVSPDGTLGATIRSDAGPLVIDLATRGVLRRLPPLPAPPHRATLTILQGWTADGRGLLLSRTTTGGDEVLAVDARTGRTLLEVPLSRSGPVEVAPDPRGRFLVVAMNDGTVLFLDARDGHELAPPTSATVGNIFNVSVSPDGRFVSATGSSALVSLFDTRTFRPIGTPLQFDVDTFARARFTRDGRVVVANGRTVSLVDVDPATWVTRACQVVGRTLTRDEWNEVLPDRPYDPACVARQPSPPAP